MFLLNIFGEEILWRGLIQNRLNTKYAWIFDSNILGNFSLVHLQLDLMLMLIPCFLIIPYAFEKTIPSGASTPNSQLCIMNPHLYWLRLE